MRASSFRQLHAPRDFSGEPFQNLIARPDRANLRFDILDGDRKFGELRLPIKTGVWHFRGTDIALTQSIVRKLRALAPEAGRDAALAAIRAGVEYYLAVEDDFDETFTDEARALIQEYRCLKQDFTIEVDSDCIEIIKPTVDRLRAIEQQLNLLPYEIMGSVYNGPKAA